MRTVLFTVVMTTMVLLTGCPILDDFHVQISIQDDGSYVFEYDGLIIDSVTKEVIASGDVLSEKDEDYVLSEYKDIFDAPGYKDTRYLGDGEFRVRYQKSMAPGESFSFIGGEFVYFRVEPTDSRVRFVMHEVPEDLQEQLQAVGIRISGRVSISSQLPTVRHDADIIRSDNEDEKTLVWEFGPGGYSERSATFSVDS
jgi:hypothetical protein